jgi:hypothetical protein
MLEGMADEGMAGDGAGGGNGNEQPSSWGVCLLLATTEALLLARMASLNVFTLFHGSGSGCTGRDGRAV